MKLTRSISIALLVILFTTIITAIFAAPSFAAEEKDPGSAWNIYFRPGVRFGTESRVLYIMDLLFPLYKDDKSIVFGNIKYTPNDRDGWELNTGMGYRRLIYGDKLNMILGVNAYYDQRRTDWGTKHSQWGVGLETMAEIPLEAFDLGLTGRFNYYYPLSVTKIDGLGTPYASYVLSDEGIVLYGGRVEEPMRGFDYEAGIRIPYISKYVETWAYVGGYNYHGRRVRDINGFMARLEVIPTNFIRLNYEFHHDNYSKAEHYGEISFEVPFSIGNLITGKNPFEGIGDMMTGSRELSARMVEPTRRDVDVKVIVDEDNGNIPGGGGEIEDVVFVSETGSDVTGNGTIDNPYATVSYALASDARILAGTCKTIHVMNSSTVAVVDEAAAAGTLTLNVSDFLLWGSGANHPTYPVSNMPFTGHPTVNDTLTLNAANPTITGLGFDVNGSDYCIEINNGIGVKIINNVFNMSRAGLAHGIYSNIGMGLGIEQNPIIIANNIFDIESTGNAAHGIYLRTTNDIFATITGNDMSNTITGDVFAYGIWLHSTGGNIGSETRPVTISGNPLTVTSNDMDAFGIHLTANNDIFATVTGNDMSDTIGGDDYAFGISLYSDSGNIGSETRPVIISGNPMFVTAISGNAYGISLTTTNDIFATITGNDMSNRIWGDRSTYGIRLYSTGGNIGSEAKPVTISGNPMFVTANDWDAMGIYLNADNDIFANIAGNGVSNTIVGDDHAYGIYLYTVSGNIGSETRPVTISGNPMTVTANTWYARGINFNANNDIFATITGNDMSNTIHGDDFVAGICLHSTGGNIGSETRPVTISGNPMTVTSNFDAYGIDLYADLGIFATITGNKMSIEGDNIGYGIVLGYAPTPLYSTNIGSEARPVIISGNTMTVTSNFDAYGIDLYADLGIFATITGNKMSIEGDNIGYGIVPGYAPTHLYSTKIGSEARPVIISGNTMTVTTNTFGAFGIYLGANNDIFATITGNNMSNTIHGDDFGVGIYLYSTGGNIGSETRPVTISGNPLTVTSNVDAYGMYLRTTNDIFATITGNDMSNGIGGYNDVYGIWLNSTGGNIGSETRPVTISGNPMTVTSNSGRALGMYLEADNDIFATITGNDMSNTIWGDDFAYGIRLVSNNGDIGSETRPVTILGNPMTVTSNDYAYGICLEANNDIFATITENDMSNGIGGYNDVYGIWLHSTGGNIGSETRPVTILGNPMTVTSNVDAYGMYLEANNDIFATITGNDMSNGIGGDDYAFGIWLHSTGGNIGSETRPVTILGNPMTVTSNNCAFGIYLRTTNDIFATIIGNDMSNTITGNLLAYGIWLHSIGGNIGSETRPVTILGNPMTVTSNDCAFGIYLEANNDIFATITENDMSNGIDGDDFGVGIYLYSTGGNIGSETRPVIISGNPMTVTSNYGSAYGISLRTTSDIFATITGNDMSNGIGGDDLAYGIWLHSTGGSIGSETRPVTISENSMFVTANSLEAGGIHFLASSNIFANTKFNYMNITSTNNIAYGAYLRAGNLIGDITSLATFFINNSGTINGAVDRYMLYLDDVGVASNSSVNWAGSVFNALGGIGTWSGNYPNPYPAPNLVDSIDTNGFGGTITP